MTKKVAFKTLGCRLNQFETDSIAAEFNRNKYEIVDFHEDADVYVINTCTVTNQSDSKSKNIMNQARRKKQDSMVVVTGCMVNNHKEKLESLDRVSYFVENEQKSSIFSLVDGHLNGEIHHPKDFKKDIFGYKPADKTFHTRSMIKIQDGCDNFCTFCIIPKVRGRATSRPKEDIIQNIKKVLDFGYKEIVLTGVNIGRYNYEGSNFEDLVEDILNIEGDFRVRISSIEPDGYGKRLFELFHHPKLAPHLHLCLQSGSEKILLQMRRMYTAKTFLEMVEGIRKEIPDFNFTTDIIVGFPGETDEDFQQSVDMANKIGFSHIHTFKYSKRKGTRADRMTEQVHGTIKTERSKAIHQISEENQLNYFNKMLGKEQRVLIEKVEDGIAKGYGEHYIPVRVKTTQHKKNEFADVRLKEIVRADENYVLGELI